MTERFWKTVNYFRKNSHITDAWQGSKYFSIKKRQKKTIINHQASTPWDLVHIWYKFTLDSFVFQKFEHFISDYNSFTYASIFTENLSKLRATS